MDFVDQKQKREIGGKKAIKGGKAFLGVGKKVSRVKNLFYRGGVFAENGGASRGIHLVEKRQRGETKKMGYKHKARRGVL